MKSKWFGKSTTGMPVSLSPTQMIAISFLSMILIGTLLFSLPISATGEPLSFVDALFMAASGICVTGLSVLDVSTQFTPFGQGVLLILIQAGGLGIMTFSTFFIYLLGRKATLRQRGALDSSLGMDQTTNIRGILKQIMRLVFVIEGAGWIILTLIFWVRGYPIVRAVYHGLFHSVSAFCNAGFSLYTTSLEPFQHQTDLNVTMMVLIILGGIGLITLVEVYNLLFHRRKPVRHLTIHSRVVICVSLVLILSGALIFYLIESGQALSGKPFSTKVLISFFQSVTARTAGFNTVKIGELSNACCTLLMFLMFIGAAPGSCGGGVKVTVLGILAAVIWSRVKGETEPSLFHRSISKETVAKVLTVMFGAALIIVTICFGLLISERGDLGPGESRGLVIEVLFESVSAFGTVGLSMGMTPQLSTTGRVLITILMFVGRIGPLTMALALAMPGKSRYMYARGDIMTG